MNQFLWVRLLSTPGTKRTSTWNYPYPIASHYSAPSVIFRVGANKKAVLFCDKACPNSLSNQEKKLTLPMINIFNDQHILYQTSSK